jgi:hypothetical protein
MPEPLGKYSHHAYAHAQPWTSFKGKQVGRKEISAREVFRPGHKANPVLDGPENTSTAAVYGGGIGFQPPPLNAVERARRQFGSHSLPADDALGPVDLNMERQILAMERQIASAAPVVVKKKKKDEPPPDTLRWDPTNSAQNGASKGGLAAAARRRAAAAEAAEEEARAPSAVAAAASQPIAVRPRLEKKDLTDPPNQRTHKSEAGLRHEEQMRVRAKLEAEARAEAERAAAMQERWAAGDHPTPEFRHPVLERFGADKVQALSDPRVIAALQAKLNEPNAASRELYKMRNTQRVSAERKY